MRIIERLENRLIILEQSARKAKCNKYVELYLKQANFVKQQINKLKR